MSIDNSHQISDVKVMISQGADGTGIDTIEKTSSQGIEDTYTITLTDGRKTTFTVTNGNGIDHIAKTGTQGLVDEYTMYFQDGSTFVYYVTNGQGGGMSAEFLITSDAGSTITVTNPSGQSVPVSQVTGSTTQWTCSDTQFGVYTISSTLNGQTTTTTVNVDVCKIYNVVISAFSATITVTYPSSATSCTCVGTNESYTATENPQTFTVHSADTYTITATDGTYTATDTVTITSDGQSESVTLIYPDGSTVTPTDDIQTWLHCADIWDKNYTTLSEVLNDSTTLSALIADNNAVDYMVRSTTWASGVCADQTAMSYIGLNNYCANTLLADSTWLSAIANSAYIESVMNVKVPTMTSDTMPSGEAFASSLNPDNLPYLAFDNNTTRPWSSVNNTTTPQSVGYKFTTRVKIRTIRLYPGGNNYPTAFKIQGSNDNTNYFDIASLTNDKTSEYVNYVLENNNAYQYYRMYITSKVTGGASISYVRVPELQFYGREDV